MAPLSPRTQLALYAALVFLVVGSSATYGLTDSIVGRVGLDLTDARGLPTRLGLFVHALVAGGLVYGYLHTFSM